MEQFNLSVWLKDKSRKVVTRDGRPVRIVCWDLPGEYKIIGVTDESDDGYTVLNKKTDGTGEVSTNDLFFADEEEELTELQKTLEEDCDCYVNLYNDGKTREELREWIKGWCHRIIDLARKELMSEISDFEIYDKGFKEGKKYALKDLPKWKKATEHKDLEKHIAILEENKVLLSNYLEEGDYYIELEDLKTLPKEE